MTRLMFFGLLFAINLGQSAFAQSKNVQDAINVIVLFCVAGGDKVEISTLTNSSDAVELKTAGGSNASIRINRSSARGLVEGIIGEMNSVSANQASEARKCMQPYIERIVDLVLGKQMSAPPTLTQNAVWIHNTSIMSVTSNGDRFTIYYQKPRQGMVDEGVTPGTILFDGIRTGSKLSGTSYVFDRRCGHIPYSDVGRILSDERTIFLNGRNVPTQLGFDCKPVAFRIDPSLIDRQD
jgi:hypothetical protein